MQTFQEIVGGLFMVGGVIVLMVIWSINSAAKKAGSFIAKDPGPSLRGGLELWKFFNK